MDATKKGVIVTTYEELPRRRPSSYGASTTAAPPRTKKPAAVGGHNRRAMLLAYAQQLRRAGGQSSSAPRMLEWHHPGVATGGDTVSGKRRSCCSKFRLCVRLWIRKFLRRAKMIKEKASCKDGDRPVKVPSTTITSPLLPSKG